MLVQHSCILIKSTRFWQWCVTLRLSRSLGFQHHTTHWKAHIFETQSLQNTRWQKRLTDLVTLNIYVWIQNSFLKYYDILSFLSGTTPSAVVLWSPHLRTYTQCGYILCEHKLCDIKLPTKSHFMHKIWNNVNPKINFTDIYILCLKSMFKSTNTL